MNCWSSFSGQRRNTPGLLSCLRRSRKKQGERKSEGTKVGPIHIRSGHIFWNAPGLTEPVLKISFKIFPRLVAAPALYPLLARRLFGFSDYPFKEILEFFHKIFYFAFCFSSSLNFLTASCPCLARGAG